MSGMLARYISEFNTFQILTLGADLANEIYCKVVICFDCVSEAEIDINNLM